MMQYRGSVKPYGNFDRGQEDFLRKRGLRTFSWKNGGGSEREEGGGKVEETGV